MQLLKVLHTAYVWLYFPLISPILQQQAVEGLEIVLVILVTNLGWV